MLFRSSLSVLILALLFSAPFSAQAASQAEAEIAIQSEAEAQTNSSDEIRADAAQQAFDEQFDLESTPATGSEPDFFHILRPKLRRKRGGKTYFLPPKVTYGVVFTGPSDYHEGEGIPIPPASTNKIFTAALALNELGGDFTYSTELTWVKSTTSAAAGYLTFVGSGDPSFATSALRSASDHYVAGLAAAGVKTVYGPLRFSATDARWSIKAIPYGWEKGDIFTHSGFIPDALGTLTTSRVKAALASALARKKIKWISSAAPFSENSGKFGHAAHVSRPLRELIRPFLLHSINYMGEAFFRKVGERKGSRAAANLNDAALPVVREFVKTMVNDDKDFGKIIINDGSGLSRASRVTARLMVKFLEAVKHEPYFSDFYAALPTAGHTGTLGRRMAGTAASGLVHAKTGTLDGNYQLAGYLTEKTKSGTEYHPFAILTDTTVANAGYCRSVEDSALAKLASWMLRK
jgi:D-alanyl-D-alanine carboxypeptidase